MKVLPTFPDAAESYFFGIEVTEVSDVFLRAKKIENTRRTNGRHEGNVKEV